MAGARIQLVVYIGGVGKVSVGLHPPSSPVTTTTTTTLHFGRPLTFTLHVMEYLPQPGPILAPLHLLFFSALLGAELYQSFVMTKVTFEVLPRSAFTTLQKRVFPLYFKGQTFLILVTAATAPPYSFASLAKSKAEWIPLVVAGITAVLNLVVYEPKTRKAMVERIHQGNLPLHHLPLPVKVVNCVLQ